MGLWPLVALSLVALVVGTFVGATGVGGLVLPPALIYAGGMAGHTATATSSWAFLLTGVAGTVTYARRGSLSVHTAAWLGAGATPGAALGAWCNGLLPGSAISAALGAVVLLGGLFALVPGGGIAAGSGGLGPGWLGGLGAAVGFGSGLTGTGGPVLLVPVLLFAGLPPLVAVAAGQVVQLPIAGAASLTYLLRGEVDVRLGTVLGIVGLSGVLAGAYVAHALPGERLRQAIGLVLIPLGATMLARSLW